VVKTLKPTIIQRLRHPGDETGVLPLLESFCFDRADLLVAVSQSTREDLSALLHIPTEKISVIAHGATPQDYVFPPEELNALRASLGAENCPLLLFVGRLEERKGVHILLDAFATLLKKREAILVLAGKGDRARYEALAVELGVASRVRFTGFLGDLQLRKLFAACDLFVLPSFWEGMGLVALEARSAGKFVIASAVGGLPEAVPNGSGLLVPPGDPVQLAQAILGGLSQNTVSLPPARTWAEAAEELNRLYLNLVDHVSSNLRHNVV
jgi:glycosyltransferase involved in cell wall biosynthesis